MTTEALRGHGSAVRLMPLPLALALLLIAELVLAAPATIKAPTVLKPKSTLTIAHPPAPVGTKSALPPTAQPTTIRPTPREELIRGLASNSDLLRQIMGQGVTVYRPGLRSPYLGQMVRLYSLAEAYAAGITLTPTGCQFSGGTYRGDAPLSYFTDRGRVYPDYMSRQELWLSRWEGSTSDDLLTVYLRTPGPASQRLSYLLELQLTIAPTFARKLRTFVNGAGVSFQPSSSGSQVALVELAGTEGGSPHQLTFRCSDRLWMEFRFDWLKATAL